MEVTRCRTVPLARRQENRRRGFDRPEFERIREEKGGLRRTRSRPGLPAATSHTHASVLWYRTVARCTLCASGHDERMRVSRKNRVVEEVRNTPTGFLARRSRVRVRASQNLSNDRDKQLGVASTAARASSRGIPARESRDVRRRKTRVKRG